MSSIRSLLIALSLANLCFLKIWRELLFTDAADRYWLPDYTSATFLAILFNVLSLTLVFYGVVAYLFRSRQPQLAMMSRLFFIAVLLIPFDFARLVFGFKSVHDVWPQGQWWTPLLLALVVGVIALYLIAFQLRQTANIVGLLLLVLSPFAFMTLTQAAWSAIRLSSPEPTTAPTQQPDTLPKQRILWLMMDELDLTFAFLDRPNGLSLPEFDRLRNQAIFANHTIGHSMDTVEAIPSFLLQKIVENARPTGPADLRIEFTNTENSRETDFSGHPNFFAEAAALNARIAVLGYYHPYCRLFRNEVRYCRNYALETWAPFTTNSVLREALAQIIGITPLFANRINAIKTFESMTLESVRLAADSSFDLIYVHASVPHGPSIWSPKTQSFTLFNFEPFYTAEEGYSGNLILADRMLGAIRAGMVRADLWDNTMVLVTSDHGWRDLPDRKSPFILKMPGQKSPFEFSAAINPMLVTKDLLLQIFQKTLTSPESVVKWLHSHPSGLTTGAPRQ